MQELRARLERDKAQVLERLELLRVDGENAEEARDGSPFANREDEATEAFEMEKRIAMERSLKDSLAEINRALARFDSGEYGRCELCGNQIERDRLEARPQATVCMRCMASQSKSGTGASQ